MRCLLLLLLRLCSYQVHCRELVSVLASFQVLAFKFSNLCARKM